MMLNKEQMERLMEQTSKMLERAEQGMSTRDIMAHIYMEGLEDKTMDQGRLMADAIIAGVASFDSQYADAKANLNGWLDETLMAIAKDMEPAERCACWMKIAAAITAASEAMISESGCDRDKILAEIEELRIPADAVTPELEQELFDKAKEAIANSNVMLAALAAQGDVLDQIENSNSAARLLLDLGSREVDFRCIASMIAYIGIKNGTIEDVPVDLKLEQVTTMVCAGIEQARIADAVEQGDLSLEVANFLLCALGAVAIICLIPSVFFSASSIISAMTSGFAAIPVCLAAVVLITWGACEAFEAWGKLSQRIINHYAPEIKAIGNGVKRVYDFIRNTVVSGALKGIQTAWNWLRQKLSSLKGTAPCDETVEETVVLALPAE